MPPGDLPHGSILNPLHPVGRINGLQFGQSWRQTVVDPRSDMLRAVYEHSGGNKIVPLPEQTKVLTAPVLPQPKILQWQPQNPPCKVIEYYNAEDVSRGPGCESVG